MADFERLLKLDPTNKKAHDQLKTLRARHDARGSVGEKVLKKNRLHIVEVEGCGRGTEEGEGEREKKMNGGGEREGARESENVEEVRRLVDKLKEQGRKLEQWSSVLETGKDNDGSERGAGPKGQSSSGSDCQQTEFGRKFPGDLGADPAEPVDQNSPPTSDSPPKVAETTSPLVEATPTLTQAPLPPAVKKLKEEGNGLFRSGQYAVASEKYSRAISELEQGIYI